MELAANAATSPSTYATMTGVKYLRCCSTASLAWYAASVLPLVEVPGQVGGVAGGWAVLRVEQGQGRPPP